MPGSGAVKFPIEFGSDVAKARHLIGDGTRYANLCRLHVGAAYLTNAPGLLSDQSVSDVTAEIVVCGVLGLGMRSSYGDSQFIRDHKLRGMDQNP